MKLLNDDHAYREFGVFIRAGRERKGYTQSEMAEMVGVSASYYCYFETGKRKMTLPMAMKLCAVLDLDMTEFIMRSVRKTAVAMRNKENRPD